MTNSNLLAGETSPYLQQHQYNPVHWQPWGQAALDSAIESGKPILLSVGYAACHWCHVMAHECFEDQEVADVMNALFVNIKVDREERPDIDQIYMAALNATGEQGGWPLTMFLTPDARPFWGGTYFPKQPRYGRPGFIQVMNSVHQAWIGRKGDIEAGADNLTNHVSEHLAATHSPSELSCKPTVELGKRISEIIDTRFGGISGAPKFPNAPYMMTLWLSARESSNAEAMHHFVDSLEKMLAGGIYDHVGGGLCRYSTDEKWQVPHFEKMLYDNAQLISLCVLAHAESGKDLFRSRIEETIEWLEREMLLESGTYASSLDADSEGEEGKFYLWTETEIRSVLGSDSDRFLRVFELVSPQNWEGNPVLVRRPGADHGLPQSVTRRLLDARSMRNRPARDDKTLTDWNGLAMAAIASAARYFDNDDWKRIAERNFAAVRSNTDETGRLPHSANDSTSLFPALSQDYAAMINAAVFLYELTSDPTYLSDANKWASLLEEDYGDGKGAHFLTSSNASDVPIRIRGDIDEAIPSATAQIIEALTRLANASSNAEIQNRAYRCASAALGRALKQSHGQAGIFNSACIAVNAAKLVIVEDPDNPELSEVAKRHPDPRRVDILVTTNSKTGFDIVPGATLDTATPGAWLCKGHSCLPPIRTRSELQSVLSNLAANG